MCIRDRLWGFLVPQPALQRLQALLQARLEQWALNRLQHQYLRSVCHLLEAQGE